MLLTLQWEGLCFHFFHSAASRFFFFPLSEMYLGTIWDSMSMAKIWIGRIKCYRHCTVESVIVLVPSVCHGEFQTIISFLSVCPERYLCKVLGGNLLLLCISFGSSLDYILPLSQLKSSKHISDVTQSKRLKTDTLSLYCHRFSFKVSTMLGGGQKEKDAIALRDPMYSPKPRSINFCRLLWLAAVL